MSQPTVHYDLEDRTLAFARRVRAALKRLPRTISNEVDGRQLLRSSGSIGANYIEANEALSKKDFVMRLKIARKESKETTYWLRLIDVGDAADLQAETSDLIRECTELMKILGAILRKCE